MRITWLLIALSVAVFVYGFYFAETEGFYNTYGFSGANMLDRPYVLVTSIFMHGSFVHLLSNILVWIFFGLAVEDELGRKRMLMIFFLGAFAGSAASLAFYPFDSLSVGASAGIFALVGAGMLARPMDMSLYPMLMPMPLIFIGMLYAILNIYGFFFDAGSNVSYIAHFGGLVVGLFFGFRHKGLKKGMLMMLATLAVMAAIFIIFTLI